MHALKATSSSATVRHDAAAVAWWVLIGAASGAIAGALVGGVGGRLAMLLLRMTSPEDVIGMLSARAMADERTAATTEAALVDATVGR